MKSPFQVISLEMSNRGTLFDILSGMVLHILEPEYDSDLRNSSVLCFGMYY